MQQSHIMKLLQHSLSKIEHAPFATSLAMEPERTQDTFLYYMASNIIEGGDWSIHFKVTTAPNLEKDNISNMQYGT